MHVGATQLCEAHLASGKRREGGNGAHGVLVAEGDYLHLNKGPHVHHMLNTGVPTFELHDA
eukprot:scaffold138522_cov30-Tisochrysis_lutea.AAC.2